VRVEWDPEAPLTPLGQASFFIEFLKASGVFDALVADCPLDYSSPNAPNKRDVLGTAVLSMLSGHKRYAHMAALRADGVLPELLGLTRVMSGRYDDQAALWPDRAPSLHRAAAPCSSRDGRSTMECPEPQVSP
jgi:hypothetical protein